MVKRCWFVVLLVLGALSCSKDNPVSIPDLPLPPTATGTWSGAAGSSFAITMNLGQIKNSITGSATIQAYNTQGDTVTDHGSVSGSNQFPDVSLTLTVSGYQPIAITGQFVTSTSMSVALNQSGFNNLPMVFTKH